MKKRRFDSVWDAIEGSEPERANMKARSELMTAILDVVDGWDLTQAESAKRLAITQPRLSDLVRGRINKFSLDALMNIAVKAGLSVSVRVTPRAA